MKDKKQDVTLRAYQKDMITQLYASWKKHNRSVMCQMPTGTGKTVVLASVVKNFLHKPNMAARKGQCTIVIVAHRKEILDQIRQTTCTMGLQDEMKDGSILVESIQKLSSLFKKDSPSFKRLSPKLVVIDEAHHATAKTYRMLWDIWPQARFLGMSATPCRVKMEGLDGLFDDMVTAPPVSFFINEGHLSLFDFITIRTSSRTMSSMLKLKKKGADGDWQIHELESSENKEEKIQMLYDAYLKYAQGKQGIIYAVSQAHALHIESFFKERGVNIVEIDSKTSASVRNARITDFRERKLDVIVNVDLFGEGVDVPECEFILLGRPTLSLAKYLQQVGRGMRISKDKEACVILDCVGNYYNFGLPNDNHDWDNMFKNGQIMNFELQRRIARLRRTMSSGAQILNQGEGLEAELQSIMTSEDLSERVARSEINRKESSGLVDTKMPDGRLQACRVISSVGGFTLAALSSVRYGNTSVDVIVDGSGNPIVYIYSAKNQHLTEDGFLINEDINSRINLHRRMFAQNFSTIAQSKMFRISSFDSELQIRKKGGLAGLINGNKWVLKPQYEDILDYNARYAIVKFGNDSAPQVIAFDGQDLPHLSNVVRLVGDDLVEEKDDTTGISRYVDMISGEEYHYLPVSVEREK